MTDETHAIHINRVFDAPRDLVFRAWTEPDLMARWLLRGKCTEVEVDATVGGRYRLCGEMPYGPAVAFGEFREIQAPERLVFTFSWEQIPIGETVVTIEFLERGEGTEMRFRQELFPDAQTAGIHEQVWPMDFDGLEALLKEV